MVKLAVHFVGPPHQAAFPPYDPGAAQLVGNDADPCLLIPYALHQLSQLSPLLVDQLDGAVVVLRVAEQSHGGQHRCY